jgi:hypothetical protein
MDITSADWRKSSYSGANGGNCVEVGKADSTIAVRDTKDRDGLVLDIPADAWRAFTAGLR